MSEQTKLELPDVERTPKRSPVKVKVPDVPFESIDYLEGRLRTLNHKRQTIVALKDNKRLDCKDDLEQLEGLEKGHETWLKNRNWEIHTYQQKIAEIEKLIAEKKVEYDSKKGLLAEKTSKYTKTAEILDVEIAKVDVAIAEIKERLKDFERPSVDIELMDLPEELRAEALQMSQSLIIERSASKPVVADEKATPEPLKAASSSKSAAAELAAVLSELQKSPLLEKVQERERERELKQTEARSSKPRKKPAKKSKSSSKFNDVLKEDRGEISSTSSSSEDAVENDDGEESEDVWEDKPKKKQKVESGFSTPTGKEQADHEFDFKDPDDDYEEREFTRNEFQVVLNGIQDDDTALKYEARRLNKKKYLVQIQSKVTLQTLKRAFKYQAGAPVSDHKKTQYKNFWDHYDSFGGLKAVEQEVLIEKREERGNDCQLCGVSIKKGELCAYANAYKDSSFKAKCTKHPLHIQCAAFLQAMMKEDPVQGRCCCIGNAYDSNNKDPDTKSKVAGCLLKN